MTQQLYFDKLPKEMKMHVYQKTYTRIFTSVLLAVEKNWNQPQFNHSPGEWLDELWHIHALKYNSAIRETDYCYGQQFR